MFPMPRASLFLKDLTKLLSEASQTLRKLSISINTTLSIVRFFLSVTVNHKSHERSFLLDKQGQSANNSNNKKRRRDELGGVKVRR
jgi:hypothetical protein